MVNVAATIMPVDVAATVHSSFSYLCGLTIAAVLATLLLTSLAPSQVFNTLRASAYAARALPAGAVPAGDSCLTKLLNADG